MQINLPDDATKLIMQQAAAAGFPNQVDAYVAHLIASDVYETCAIPAELSVAGKGREEIETMLSAGIESGPATPFTAEDWQQLHARVDQRSQTNS